MGRLRSWISVIPFLFSLVWSASMRLPSYPLAVKTPYLSVWMPGHLAHNFPNATPQFWQGAELTWIILTRIDGTTYCLLGCTGGRPGTTQATQKSLNFSSTHTYVTLEAGSTEVSLDFFSAVDPIDHVRQSLPYTYVTVAYNRTARPDIDVLTAVDTSWLSNRGEPIANTFTANGSRIVTLNGKQEVQFAENRNMALWGDVVLATKGLSKGGSSSCRVGSPSTLFGSFFNNGDLMESTNVMEPGHIAACTQTIEASKSNGFATFAIGLHQDKAIQYFDGNSTKSRSPYFRSKVANVSDTVKHLFDDYDEALTQSRKLDQYIRDMGEVTSSNYSDLLEFAVRQCFGGQQVTIPYDTLDTNEPYAFIKEISTNGNTNTLADLIPKALPIFHVLNPQYTRMFIEPVLRFSLKGWPLNHAVHDIGKHYPNATGETPCIEEFLPLDSTSVLLWMLHLYQNNTGNTELTETYKPILQRYADYCFNYGLLPVLQRSSVDALRSAPNQTALSVSAAIALNAYGEMTGQKNYTEFGLAFAEQILDIGRDSNQTHFLTHYGDEDTEWILMYPLAFDAWLGLKTFPSWVHESQSKWYWDHRLPYGVQYRNNIRYTLMEWQMWAAATVANEVRDHMVNAVHMFLSRETDPNSSVPGPTQWVIVPGDDEGQWTHFSRAKSVIGSIYMIAAIQGGFNTSYIAKEFPPASAITPHEVASMEEESHERVDSGISAQHPALPPVGYVVRHNTNNAITQYDIPYEVPIGASRPVDSSFLGLSFDTASFPKYMGNITTPNEESLTLIHNLIDASNSMLTIRIGSPEGDYSIFDPIQSIPLDRVNVSEISTLSIGPPFFDSIRALDRFARTEWIYQVPFAAYDIHNARLGAAQAADAIPDGRLYALEIGHKANLYAGSVRPENYNCRLYASEFFKYKLSLRRHIGRVNNQFQALALSHREIADSWTLEECFTVGIKAQNDLRSVSIHYSQTDSHNELLKSRIPRHSAVQREHEQIVPQANYIRDIYPCHPFVISEASLVSTTAKDYDTAVAEFAAHNSLELGLWHLDFLLYAMSRNISKVLMHQSCDSVSSAWIPGACRSEADDSTYISASYYALTFIASFVRGARNVQVIPVQETEDTVVYAGYESGKLAKIAVVNFPPSEESENKLEHEFSEKTITLRVAPTIRHLNEKLRINTSTLGKSSTDRPSAQWSASDEHQQAPIFDEPQMPAATFSLSEDALSITLLGGEALLLEVPR